MILPRSTKIIKLFLHSGALFSLFILDLTSLILSIHDEELKNDWCDWRLFNTSWCYSSWSSITKSAENNRRYEGLMLIVDQTKFRSNNCLRNKQDKLTCRHTHTLLTKHVALITAFKYFKNKKKLAQWNKKHFKSNCQVIYAYHQCCIKHSYTHTRMHTLYNPILATFSKTKREKQTKKKTKKIFFRQLTK